MHRNTYPSKKFILLGIWKHLSKRRKKQFLFLPIIIVFTGISEIFSIASVIPFLTILSDSSETNNISLVNDLYQIFGKFSNLDPILFSISIFLICVSTSAFLRLLTIYCINFFSAAVGSDFSKKAYRLSLNQPYSIHIKRNSSLIISSIVSNTDRVGSVIVSILNLFTATIIGFALIYSLFLINWILSILIAIIFCSLYLILGVNLKKRLKKVSQSRASLTNLQTKSLQEGLGSIRDIILDNSQKFYLNLFSKNDRILRFISAKSDFIASSPRYIFELLTLYIIIIIAYFYSKYTGSSNSILPLLGSIILGLQRLLPTFQIGYASWVNISTNTNSVFDLLKLLDQKERYLKNDVSKLVLKKSIRLINVSFSYSKKNIIENFNLTIKKGDRLGIVGRSGSGKSTIADLVMALLEPSKGILEIDGIDLNKNNIYSKENWYKNISHVPQDIYLSDTNIAENIAFGIPAENINKKKLMNAIKASKLTDLIKNENEAFNIPVGERGVQISGGQRQRIGIARAIYKGGRILVLDEATSALDLKTENEIMETIYNLDPDLTILIITHRLNTLKKCNRIIDLNKI